MGRLSHGPNLSRFIAGHGVYPILTSPYSVEVLDGAIKRYGKPKSILSDHGSTFYAVESVAREKGLTEFEKYLLKNKIRLARKNIERAVRRFLRRYIRRHGLKLEELDSLFEELMERIYDYGTRE